MCLVYPSRRFFLGGVSLGVRIYFGGTMLRRKLLCLSGLLGFCLAANVAVAEDLAQDLKQLSAPPSVKAAAPACVEPAKDPSIWDKSVLFGLNYTDGNTKTTNINLGGKVARDYENNAWRFQADYNYGAAADNANDPRVENKNNFRAVGDYRRILENDWFAGGGTAFAHDEIADLKYRVIVSPSAGRYLIRDENTKFSLEAGPSYVWEKLGEVDSNFAAARVADRLELTLTPTSKIYQFFEYLISFDDASQYLFNAEIGIESALNSYLSLVLSVKDYYINQPAEGNVPNDVVTITALKVTL
jgi:putative salt-induced outer membrane protein YdiY